MSGALGSLSAGGAGAFALLVVLKATLVLLLALAADRLLARASAASRHLVWAAAFGALLALPALQALTPPVDIAVIPARAEDSGGAGLSAAHDESGQGAAAEVLAAAGGRGEAGRGAGSAAGGAGFAERAPGPDLAKAGGPTVRRLLGAAYLAVAVVLLVAPAVGLVRAHRIARRARPLDDDGWAELLADAARRNGLVRPPRLLASAEFGVPVVWGGMPGVATVVLLPAAARTWTAGDRRSVLVHELAHLARRDWPVQLAARTACALLWFHPLAWIGLRRLVLEAERACDDRVVAAGVASCEYADQLVALARRVAPRPTVAAVAMARPGQLSHRVRSLLDPSRRRGTAGPAIAGAALAASAVAALLLAPVRPVEAHPERAVASPAASGRAHGDRAWAYRDIAEREDRMTPLMRAAWRGEEAEARRLLGAGADPDESAAALGTPLILASDRGDEAMVALLLEAGADPNRAETTKERPGDLQRTPLGSAARSGDLGTVRRLLTAGAEVDAAPPGDATPLMTASRWGHLDLVRELLAHGADANAAVRGDGTPLIEAAREGHSTIVEELLAAGARLDTAVRGDGNPIVVAAAGGHLPVVERLLAAGADPDVFVPGDESALYHAIERDDTRMVGVLLAAGADPNVDWPGDGTPLAVAAETGRMHMVPLLVAAGAEADAEAWGDAFGDGDEWEADRDGDADGDDRGRDGDADADRRRTAWLRLSADGRSLVVPRSTIVEVRGSGSLAFPSSRAAIEVPGGLELAAGGERVGAGAAVRARSAALVDRSGRAVWSLRPVSGTELRGPGTRITDSRVTSSRIDSAVPTRFYLAVADDGTVTYFEPAPSAAEARRARSAFEGDGGPLIVAARSGDADTVRLLLDRGADPNRGVEGDGSPLIAAARAGRLETVRLLLDRGAEVDLVVPGDENALIQAAGSGRLEVARLLLDRGADPNSKVVANRTVRNPAGEVRTPLRMAIRGGHRDVAELLLDRGATD